MKRAQTNFSAGSVRQFPHSWRFGHSRHRLAKAILETLEVRTLMSTYVVNTLVDDGSLGSGLSGPLRWTIAQASAAGGDQTITFDSSLTASGPAAIDLGSV